MKTSRLLKIIGWVRRGDVYRSHVAVGALLVVTILYASTII